MLSAHAFASSELAIGHCWKNLDTKPAASLLETARFSSEVLSFKPGYLQNVARESSLSCMVKGKDDPVCRRISWLLHDLDPDVFFEPTTLDELQPTRLRVHVGRFGGWQKVVSRSAASVKYIQVIRNGEVHGGASAFVIAPGILITAGHVARQGDLRVGFHVEGPAPAEFATPTLSMD